MVNEICAVIWPDFTEALCTWLQSLPQASTPRETALGMAHVSVKIKKTQKSSNVIRCIC